MIVLQLYYSKSETFKIPTVVTPIWRHGSVSVRSRKHPFLEAITGTFDPPPISLRASCPET